VGQDRFAHRDVALHRHPIVPQSARRSTLRQGLDRPLRTLATLDRFGLVEWHTGEPTLRMLQVPELRRAMGFPETFKLDRGSRRERIKLLGNAVCPPVMQAIVEGLIADRADTAPQVAAA
jgi:DNA (cytosine-5)-methyltransferase 1